MWTPCPAGTADPQWNIGDPSPGRTEDSFCISCDGGMTSSGLGPDDQVFFGACTNEAQLALARPAMSFSIDVSLSAPLPPDLSPDVTAAVQPDLASFGISLSELLFAGILDGSTSTSGGSGGAPPPARLLGAASPGGDAVSLPKGFNFPFRAQKAQQQQSFITGVTAAPPLSASVGVLFTTATLAEQEGRAALLRSTASLRLSSALSAALAQTSSSLEATVDAQSVVKLLLTRPSRVPSPSAGASFLFKPASAAAVITSTTTAAVGLITLVAAALWLRNNNSMWKVAPQAAPRDQPEGAIEVAGGRAVKRPPRDPDSLGGTLGGGPAAAPYNAQFLPGPGAEGRGEALPSAIFRGAAAEGVGMKHTGGESRGASSAPPSPPSSEASGGAEEPPAAANSVQFDNVLPAAGGGGEAAAPIAAPSGAAAAPAAAEGGGGHALAGACGGASGASAEAMAIVSRPRPTRVGRGTALQEAGRQIVHGLFFSHLIPPSPATEDNEA
jgi:hypothetical protein